jgi:hypothetical protein
MCGSKKYKKHFYGYITENLEDDGSFPIEVIFSPKISENKKTSDRIKVTSNDEVDNKLLDTFRPKIIESKYKKSNIRRGKIIIAHHKPNKKIYYGSKTNKKRIPESKKFYNIFSSLGNHNENQKKMFRKKKKKIDLY